MPRNFLFDSRRTGGEKQYAEDMISGKKKVLGMAYEAKRAGEEMAKTHMPPHRTLRLRLNDKYYFLLAGPVRGFSYFSMM